MKSDNPMESKVFIARNEKELYSSQGSKYSPVSLSEIIKVIKKEKGKFAIVGLPCHLKGLQAIMKQDKEIDRKIIFTIGLFCSRTTSREYLYEFIKKLKVDQNKIEKVLYRAGKWPGFFLIKLKNNKVVKIPYWKYWIIPSNYFFIQNSCLYCANATNESADISCGDAWLPDIKKYDKLGTSVIVSRNSISEKILKGALLNNFIKINQLDPLKVIESQWTLLYFKKIGCCKIKFQKYGPLRGGIKILQEDGLFGLNAALFPLISKKISSFECLINNIILLPPIFYRLYGIMPSIIGMLWYKKWKKKYDKNIHNRDKSRI